MTIRRLMCVLAASVMILPASACAEPRGPSPTLDVTSVLGGEPDTAFSRVVAPRPFVFPDDHGPHPSFKTEWWYVTANLADARGNRFGVQFTIFRSALAPPTANAPTAWSSPQVYMAHVALTDVNGGTFHAEERFSRAAVGLAGATASPFRVWLEDWQMATIDPTAETIFPLHVRAAMDEAVIDLRLDAGKSIVLQGDRGFSPKGPGVGDASHYYSFTRLAASGRLTIAGATSEVVGTAWLDREWSTSVLGREQSGWDWFALQLDDGRDVMVFELRSDSAPVRDGVLVGRAGSTARLSGSDFEIDVLGEWVSPATRVRYPSGWRVRLPGEELDMVVEPLLRDQEHVGAFLYWEGAVRLLVDGLPAGVGYVELTGYDQPARDAETGSQD